MFASFLLCRPTSCATFIILITPVWPINLTTMHIILVWCHVCKRNDDDDDDIVVWLQRVPVTETATTWWNMSMHTTSRVSEVARSSTDISCLSIRRFLGRFTALLFEAKETSGENNSAKSALNPFPSLLPQKDRDSHQTVWFRPSRISTPNRTSIRSDVFVPHGNITERHTNRQTDITLWDHRNIVMTCSLRWRL